MLLLDKANIEEMSGHTVEESIPKYIQPFTQSLAPSCTFLTSFGNKSNALFPQSRSINFYINSSEQFVVQNIFSICTINEQSSIMF